MDRLEMQMITEALERLAKGQDDLKAEIKSIRNLLDGNGTPSHGIIVRLDRLEVDAKRRDNWVKAAIGSSVGMVCAVIGSFIKQSLKP